MPIEMIKLRWSGSADQKIRARVWYSPKHGLTCDNLSEAKRWVWMGIVVPGGPRIFPQDNPRAFFDALQANSSESLFKSTPAATVTRQGGDPFPATNPDPHAVELVEIYSLVDGGSLRRRQYLVFPCRWANLQRPGVLPILDRERHCYPHG